MSAFGKVGCPTPKQLKKYRRVVQRRVTDELVWQLASKSDRSPVADSAPTARTLVFDLLLDWRVRPQPPPLVFLVHLDVAFEPFHLAVAFEGQDLGGPAVEEAAVMGDGHSPAGGSIRLHDFDSTTRSVVG